MSEKNESENDLEQCFKNWDPMRADFEDLELNQYITGPGAALSSSSSFKEDDSIINFHYLILKKVPRQFDICTIKHIFGEIDDIHHIQYDAKKDTYLLYLKTIGAVEHCIVQIEKSDYGIEVEIGKPKVDNAVKVPFTKKNNSVHSMKYDDINIDWQSRTIALSNSAPPHPTFNLNFIKDSYNTNNFLLLKNDPKNLYIMATDEHILERANIFQMITAPLDCDGIYVYSSGRLRKRFANGVLEQSLKEVKCINTVPKKVLMEQLNVQRCISCGRLCASFCTNCLSSFCNVKCLENASSMHNKTCGQAIKLEYSLKEEVIVDRFHENHMPPSGEKVSITSFLRSNIICVRSESYSKKIKYFDLLKTIQKYANNYKILQAMPKCGQLVLLKIETEYVRAMVLKTEGPNTIYLVCVDYGNIEVQPINKLYRISPKLAALARYVTPVMLKAVPDCFLHESYREFLYANCDRSIFQIVYNKNDFNEKVGLFEVELWDEAVHLSININLIDLYTPIEPTKNKNILFEGSLIAAPLPIGKNLELVVMDNTLIEYGFISCTTKAYSLVIEKYANDIEAYAKSLPEYCYAPQINELCIAKYSGDGKWCRGRCLELVGDGNPTILFLDYGNIDLVNVKNIRRFPHKFMFPILTTECDIDGFNTEVYKKESTKLEKQFAIGSIVNFDEIIYQKDSNLYIVKLDDLWTTK